MSQTVRIQKTSLWFKELPEKLDSAVKEYDLPNTDNWVSLDELSSLTLFEGIEVYGDSAVVEKDTAIAPATVYVTLQYEPNSDEPAIFHDSYPANVFFHVEGNANQIVVVDRIDVDTSSFYE